MKAKDIIQTAALCIIAVVAVVFSYLHLADRIERKVQQQEIADEKKELEDFLSHFMGNRTNCWTRIVDNTMEESTDYITQIVFDGSDLIVTKRSGEVFQFKYIIEMYAIRICGNTLTEDLYIGIKFNTENGREIMIVDDSTVLSGRYVRSVD